MEECSGKLHWTIFFETDILNVDYAVRLKATEPTGIRLQNSSWWSGGQILILELEGDLDEDTYNWFSNLTSSAENTFYVSWWKNSSFHTNKIYDRK